MAETEGKDLKSESFKYGIILGFISIILTLLVYIIDVTTLVNWKYNIGSLILVLSLVVYFGRKFRNEETEGFISYGQSYLFSFITMLSSSFMVALFMMLLYNVIDPDVTEIILDETIENTESMMRRFGADDVQIDETIEQTEESLIENFTPEGILKNSWVYVLTGGFFSLITGAFIKKSKPDFDY